MNHFNWIIQLDVVLYQSVYFTLPITQQLLKREKKRENVFQNSFSSLFGSYRALQTHEIRWTVIFAVGVGFFLKWNEIVEESRIQFGGRINWILITENWNGK